jgi:hypothetical protein
MKAGNSGEQANLTEVEVGSLQVRFLGPTS